MRFLVRIFISPCLLYLDKNFVYELRERYFKKRLYRVTKILFWNTVVQYVTVWLVRIWAYKNADEKENTFFIEKKKRTEADEKRILRKSTFKEYYFNYLT